jgi:hypothetical protein
MQYQDRTVLGKKQWEIKKFLTVYAEKTLNYEKTLPFAIFDQFHDFLDPYFSS